MRGLGKVSRLLHLIFVKKPKNQLFLSVVSGQLLVAQPSHVPTDRLQKAFYSRAFFIPPMHPYYYIIGE